MVPERVQPERVPRCVAWLASGATLGRELSDAMARRGIRILPAKSDFQVLAEVGLLRRDQAGGPLILILVEPSRLANAARVIEACERHMHPVHAWEYTPGANPALRAHVPARVDVPQVVVPKRPNSNGAAPRLRLVGPTTDDAPEGLIEAKIRPEPATHEEASMDRASENADALLTDEELRMLLGEEGMEDEQE